ncbi:hypothetical protein [Pseudomonas sp. IPO3774]|uniref:hypothetical protein n=1 Tax=Pseudomonas sp. IPO3774 TaxID=2738826 RepID=UPI0015A2D4F1|nr:hypothetical protein [Pseudomonas sp. IPO3774]NWD65965.1 hypothetical protein [Pseudomonas sp. IPO3774]
MYNYKSIFFKPSIVSSFFLLVGSLVSTQALAVSVDIAAEFVPDATSPANNSFLNTTPNTGFCARLPMECKRDNLFSIQFSVETNEFDLEANHADPRQGAMLKIFSDWKDVTVQNSSGNTETVKFRMVAFGARYRAPEGAYGGAWEGGDWRYPAGPCTFLGNILGNQYQLTFMWRTVSGAVCSKKALVDINRFSFTELNFAYELIAPEPLNMGAGVYFGSVSYSLGPGQDIDFGDVLIPTDSLLNIDFTLGVSHIFNVQFPPGADRLTLIPAGGWQQWLQHGRRPEKLFANQSFQIWSSTIFKMSLQCQYPVGNSCGIQNEDGDLVPVETRATLPTGVMELSGMAVNRHLLSNSNPSIFHPSQYVDNGRAMLHFEVSRDSVAQMTNHAGSLYSGNVTVVFDSDI